MLHDKGINPNRAHASHKIVQVYEWKFRLGRKLDGQRAADKLPAERD
jgi:hypothetical protein